MDNQNIAKVPIEKVDRTPVSFVNQDSGLNLAGIVYRPRNRKETDKLPAVIVCGPMLSVKELTQSLYAQFLAEKGYATLVIDNSYIGSSEGHPRGLEDPDVKASDIRSAVTFLMSQPYIDGNRIAGVGICGSGSYMPYAAKDDARIKAVVSIVPFTIMDTIVTAPNDVLLKDKENYEKGAEPVRLDLIAGSEGVDYYFNLNRGAAANMVNPVSWSQISWHKFHPTELIKDLHVPYMVITSEKAFTRQGAELMFKNANEPKEFHLVAQAGHFDMYDLEPYVDENLSYILKFLDKYMK